MMKKSALSTLLLALVFSISFISCKHKDKDKTPEPTPTDNSNSTAIADGTTYKLNMAAFEQDGDFHLYGSPDGSTYPQLDITFYGQAIPTSDGTYSGVVFLSLNNSGIYTGGTHDYTIKVNNGTYSISIPSTTLTSGPNSIPFSAEVSCKLK